jgi:hypothetical protein
MGLVNAASLTSSRDGNHLWTRASGMNLVRVFGLAVRRPWSGLARGARLERADDECADSDAERGERDAGDGVAGHWP